MAAHFQLNLGALRSSISLTLHTHHAARIWQGRAGREGVHPIIGMAGYIHATNQIKQAAAGDDPYADWSMLQIEERLQQAKASLSALGQQLDRINQGIPLQITVGDNFNLHPVTLPLFIGSQLGFLGVYLLTDYDTLVRRILLAHHTALLSRVEMEQAIDSGAHQLRSLFGLVQHYRPASVKRGDFLAQNARALAAIERFGLPPADILEGRRRSRFAPAILRSPVEDESAIEERDEDAAPGHDHEHV